MSSSSTAYALSQIPNPYLTSEVSDEEWREILKAFAEKYDPSSPDFVRRVTNYLDSRATKRIVEEEEKARKAASAKAKPKRMKMTLDETQKQFDKEEFGYTLEDLGEGLPPIQNPPPDLSASSQFPLTEGGFYLPWAIGETPGTFKGKGKKRVVIPKKEFVKEHTNLIRILSKGTKKQRVAEAKKQSKELKGGAFTVRQVPNSNRFEILDNGQSRAETYATRREAMEAVRVLQQQRRQQRTTTPPSRSPPRSPPPLAQPFRGLRIEPIPFDTERSPPPSPDPVLRAQLRRRIGQLLFGDPESEATVSVDSPYEEESTEEEERKEEETSPKRKKGGRKLKGGAYGYRIGSDGKVYIVNASSGRLHSGPYDSVEKALEEVVRLTRDQLTQRYDPVRQSFYTKGIPDDPQTPTNRELINISYPLRARLAASQLLKEAAQRVSQGAPSSSGVELKPKAVVFREEDEKKRGREEEEEDRETKGKKGKGVGQSKAKVAPLPTRGTLPIPSFEGREVAAKTRTKREEKAGETVRRDILEREIYQLYLPHLRTRDAKASFAELLRKATVEDLERMKETKPLKGGVRRSVFTEIGERFALWPDDVESLRKEFRKELKGVRSIAEGLANPTTEFALEMAFDVAQMMDDANTRPGDRGRYSEVGVASPPKSAPPVGDRPRGRGLFNDESEEKELSDQIAKHLFRRRPYKKE